MDKDGGSFYYDTHIPGYETEASSTVILNDAPYWAVSIPTSV